MFIFVMSYDYSNFHSFFFKFPFLCSAHKITTFSLISILHYLFIYRLSCFSYSRLDFSGFKQVIKILNLSIKTVHKREKHNNCIKYIAVQQNFTVVKFVSESLIIAVSFLQKHIKSFLK